MRCQALLSEYEHDKEQRSIHLHVTHETRIAEGLWVMMIAGGKGAEVLGLDVGLCVFSAPRFKGTPNESHPF